MTPAEVAEIAGKLTAKRAQVLIDLKPGGVMRYSRVWGPTRGWLFRNGMLQHSAQFPVAHFEMTPFGELVRKYLMEQGRGDSQAEADRRSLHDMEVAHP